MELILLITIILLLTLCVGLILCLMGKNDQLDSKFDFLIRRNSENFDKFFNDLGGLYQTIGDIEEKISNVPDLIKEDIYRSMDAIKSNIEPTMPKTNNWDSVRKAFKGPSRIDIDVRN